MIRRSELRSLAFAAAIAAAISPAAAMDAGARRAEIAALRTQAQSAGPIRVIVELRVGQHASRRVLNGIQRDVVVKALGAEAWRQRGGSDDAHAVPEMTAAHHFAATVTAAEIDRLAAHPRVRRVAAEAVWTPSPKKSAAPAK